jgi:tripartite-type tricarboxylate transporter receptor subunit TctC
MIRILITAACGLIALHAGTAHAQATGNFPARALRIVVPVAAGGNVDIVARAVAQGLGERVGHQVVVENRPSASSLVGTQAVAKSPADGYTLLAIANTFVSAPAIVSAPGYDPVKDFTGVTLTCRIPMVLVVNPALPVRSVKELIALAKARPGAVTYATSGNGSTGHIAAEIFSRQAGVKMLHIPYKGNSQSLTDLVGGQVMIMFDQVSTSAPFVNAGKLRPIGVTTRTRSALFPDVPTIDEAGLKGYEDVTFNGIMAPIGVPRDALERLQSEIAKVLAVPELRKRYLERGIELEASRTPDEFSAYIKSQVENYARIARDAGIKAD